MAYEHLENEDALKALDNMREELAAASGILDIMRAAFDCEGLDLSDEVAGAADGLKLLVDRQRYRLEKHYDDLVSVLLKASPA